MADQSTPMPSKKRVHPPPLNTTPGTVNAYDPQAQREYDKEQRRRKRLRTTFEKTKRRMGNVRHKPKSRPPADLTVTGKDSNITPEDIKEFMRAHEAYNDVSGTDTEPYDSDEDKEPSTSFAPTLRL